MRNSKLAGCCCCCCCSRCHRRCCSLHFRSPQQMRLGGHQIWVGVGLCVVSRSLSAWKFPFAFCRSLVLNDRAHYATTSRRSIHSYINAKRFRPGRTEFKTQNNSKTAHVQEKGQRGENVLDFNHLQDCLSQVSIISFLGIFPTMATGRSAQLPLSFKVKVIDITTPASKRLGGSSSLRDDPRLPFSIYSRLSRVTKRLDRVSHCSCPRLRMMPSEDEYASLIFTWSLESEWRNEASTFDASSPGGSSPWPMPFLIPCRSQSSS